MQRLARVGRRLGWWGLAGWALVVLAACSGAGLGAATPTEASPEMLFVQGRCGACHIIPGVAQATGTVGPPLCEVTYAYARGELTVEDIMADIAQPNRRVHEGYLDKIMPDDYTERFDQQALRRMAEYLTRLPCPQPTQAPATTPSATEGGAS